jgi:WD40 repeat protein
MQITLSDESQAVIEFITFVQQFKPSIPSIPLSIVAHKLSALTGHKGAIYALEQGPEGGILFSGGADKLVTAWNLTLQTNLPFQAHFPAPVYSICYVAEKNLLLVGTSAGSLHIVDLEEKKEIKILQHHTAQIFDIRYSIKHKSIYSIGGDGNFAHCSLDSLSLIRIKKMTPLKLRQIDINADETELALASGDGTITLLNLETMEQKTQFHAHEFSANAVKYHPSGKILLSGGKDALLKAWDLNNNCLNIHSIAAHNFAIYDIRFSPDKRLFATASRDKTIKLWNASTLDFLLRINSENQAGHVNSVNALFWSETPDVLISAGDDRALMIWELKEG